MDPSAWVNLAALLLTGLTLWLSQRAAGQKSENALRDGLAEIRTVLARYDERLRHLDGEVGRVAESVQDVRTRQSDHHERLVRVEVRGAGVGQ